MRYTPLFLASVLTLSISACFCGCGSDEQDSSVSMAEADQTSTATVSVSSFVTTTTADEITTAVSSVQDAFTTTSSSASSASASATAASTSQVTSAPPVITTVEYGINRIENNVIVADSGTNHPRAIEQFCGNYDNGKRYGQLLNSYAAAVGPSVHTWLMVPPTSQAFYQPGDIPGFNGTQKDHFENITSVLSGVTGVPVIDVLSAHEDEPIYSRTDYHWQPLAAYYAAGQFAGAAGVPFPMINTYQQVTLDGYLGAFYTVNHISELENFPEYFTYYKPANNESIVCTYYDTAFRSGQKSKLFFEGGTPNYCVFVGRDNCILEVDTDTDNDRVLVIFKDSFGNALVPFLTQSFSKIYLCDIRYFDINAVSFIKNVGATDLLFAVCTTNALANHNLNYIEQNLKK